MVFDNGCFAKLASTEPPVLKVPPENCITETGPGEPLPSNISVQVSSLTGSVSDGFTSIEPRWYPHWGSQHQSLLTILQEPLAKAHCNAMLLAVHTYPSQKGAAVASKVIVEVTDDLDGSRADETIKFTIDNTSYEIDLSKTHAQELRGALEPYMKAGRKTGKRDGRRRSAGASDKDQVRAMREWAKEHGMKVSDRGRVSAEVQEAYNAAR